MATKSWGRGVSVFDVAGIIDTTASSSGSGNDEEEEEGSAHVCSSDSGAPLPEQLGLCWSPTQAGLLLSTCERGLVCAYHPDAGLSRQQHKRARGGSLPVQATFDGGHVGSSVNDVAFAGEVVKIQIVGIQVLFDGIINRPLSYMRNSCRILEPLYVWLCR